MQFYNVKLKKSVEVDEKDFQIVTMKTADLQQKHLLQLTAKHIKCSEFFRKLTQKSTHRYT